MNLRHLLTALSLATLMSGPAFAVDTPSELAGATLVTADRAKELAAKGAHLIDVRSGNEFAEGHIQGAKSVPYKEKSDKKVGFDAGQDSFDLAKLPADKGAEMIVYCNGIECWKSYKAGFAVLKAGYKKVYWLRGGMPEWKGKGYPVE